MSNLNSYQPRRFQSTVAAYARFRLGYPDRLIRRVIELVGLKPGDPVLDLGCGEGDLLRALMDLKGVRAEGIEWQSTTIATPNRARVSATRPAPRSPRRCAVRRAPSGAAPARWPSRDASR